MNGFSVCKINFLTLVNNKNEMVPAITGDITQLAVIEATLGHWITSTPIPTAAKPTIAPTIECVVDTGQPKYEAINNHMPAASKVPSMPKTSSSGVSLMTAASIIPSLMVAVTSPPAR